jgi:hypothetical protein
MSLVTCTECGGQMSTSARFCPHCGSTKVRFIRVRNIIVTCVLVFVVLLLLTGVITLFMAK